MDNMSTAAPSSKSSIIDDESLSTCTTESETYETWTLVTDKYNKNNPETAFVVAATNKQNDCNNGVEILKQGKDTDAAKETEEDIEFCKPKAEEESNIDDLSDGISIISESESAGRISPHPYLHEHLNEHLNLKFGTSADAMVRPQLAPPNAPILLSTTSLLEDNENHNRQLRQRRISRSSAERKALQLRTSEDNSTIEKPSTLLRICYVGFLLLALFCIVDIYLADYMLISRDDLEQRFSEMETRNNLLHKKVEVLSQQMDNWNKEKRQVNGDGNNKLPKYVKLDKSFQEWFRFRKPLNPEDITKEGIVHAFMCADGSFVKVMGGCFENKSKNLETLTDEFGNAKNDILEKSESFPPLKNVATEVETIAEDPISSEVERDAQRATKTMQHEAKIKESNNEAKSNQNRNEQQRQQGNKFRRNSKENEEDNFKERNQYQHRHAKSNENRWKHEKHCHHEDYREDDDGGERVSTESHEEAHVDDFRESFEARKYNSRERFGKYEKREHHHDNSAEKPISTRKYGSNEHFDKDGHWHEKRMQNREQARRQKNQHNNKNWFIERGNSREQMRHS